MQIEIGETFMGFHMNAIILDAASIVVPTFTNGRAPRVSTDYSASDPF